MLHLPQTYFGEFWNESWNKTYRVTVLRLILIFYSPALRHKERSSNIFDWVNAGIKNNSNRVTTSWINLCKNSEKKEFSIHQIFKKKGSGIENVNFVFKLSLKCMKKNCFTASFLAQTLSFAKKIFLSSLPNYVPKYKLSNIGKTLSQTNDPPSLLSINSQK